jgi:four helix bundle protein
MKYEVQRTKEERKGEAMNDGPSDGREKPFDLCQRTFRFAVYIVEFCRKLDERPGVSWALSKQLLRSGTSIGANVEEGQAAQSRADFVSKYFIARKEARETKYWLRLIAATGIRAPDEVQPLLNETEELLRILTTIIKNTQSK